MTDKQQRASYGAAAVAHLKGRLPNPFPRIMGPNAMAYLQATCPLSQLRAKELAVQNARRACEMTGHSDPLNLRTYAASLAGAGDFEAAIRWQRRAIEELPAEGDRGLQAQMQAELQLYESGQPRLKV